MRVLIVEARYYDALQDEMVAGAAAALADAGADHEIVTVPGALEVPGAIALAHFARARYDAFVALGVVLRGETLHYEIVCQQSARGLMDLTTRYGLCVGNGILTCETEEQAWRRARVGELDKGGGAARAALLMARLKSQFAAAP